MQRGLIVIAFVAGCGFPTPSEGFSCGIDSDCAADRQCEQGFCVVGERDAAVVTPAADAHPAIDAKPDADPFIAISMQCLGVGYVHEAGPNGFYRNVATAKTWLDAQTDCKNDVPNATHLIVLSTAAEVTFMDTLLAADAWVGLSDQTTENTFVTVTGEIGDQRPFRAGEPNNGGGSGIQEDCIVMRGVGGLDDAPCNSGFRYICECDGQLSLP